MTETELSTIKTHIQNNDSHLPKKIDLDNGIN